VNVSDNWIPIALILAILAYNVAELFAPPKNCPAAGLRLATIAEGKP